LAKGFGQSVIGLGELNKKQQGKKQRTGAKSIPMSEGGGKTKGSAKKKPLTPSTRQSPRNRQKA